MSSRLERLYDKLCAKISKLILFQEDVFDFFQTLCTCHTVQVAGHENEANGIVLAEFSDTATTATPQPSSPSNDEDDPEQLQKVTTFNNISEENENNTAVESELDEVDFISKLERLIPSDDIMDVVPAPEYANVHFAAKYDQFNSPDGKEC